MEVGIRMGRGRGALFASQFGFDFGYLFSVSPFPFHYYALFSL